METYIIVIIVICVVVVVACIIYNRNRIFTSGIFTGGGCADPPGILKSLYNYFTGTKYNLSTACDIFNSMYENYPAGVDRICSFCNMTIKKGEPCRSNESNMYPNFLHVDCHEMLLTMTKKVAANCENNFYYDKSRVDAEIKCNWCNNIIDTDRPWVYQFTSKTESMDYHLTSDKKCFEEYVNSGQNQPCSKITIPPHFNNDD